MPPKYIVTHHVSFGRRLITCLIFHLLLPHCLPQLLMPLSAATPGSFLPLCASLFAFFSCLPSPRFLPGGHMANAPKPPGQQPQSSKRPSQGHICPTTVQQGHAARPEARLFRTIGVFSILFLFLVFLSSPHLEIVTSTSTMYTVFLLPQLFLPQSQVLPVLHLVLGLCRITTCVRSCWFTLPRRRRG